MGSFIRLCNSLYLIFKECMQADFLGFNSYCRVFLLFLTGDILSRLPHTISTSRRTFHDCILQLSLCLWWDTFALTLSFPNLISGKFLPTISRHKDWSKWIYRNEEFCKRRMSDSSKNPNHHTSNCMVFTMKNGYEWEPLTWRCISIYSKED